MKPVPCRSKVMRAALKLIEAGATLCATMFQTWKEAQIRAVKEALTLDFV